jgi:ribosomal protein L40E
MPIRHTNCTKCEWTGERLYKNNEDKICPKCGALLSIDAISTAKKGVMFERVPGGYDDVKLNSNMMTDEGIEQQAAYLAGQARSAY